MLIKYGKRTALLSGELTFEPAVFYAQLNSFSNWEPPFDEEKIDDAQKKEIVGYLSTLCSSTKIVFE